MASGLSAEPSSSGARIDMVDPMPICERCGEANPEGSEFCNHCGASLRSSGLPEDRSGVHGRGKTDNAYVRWTSWPWSTFRTTEQTKEQFLITSVAFFMALGLVAIAFVAAGQSLCGVFFLLVFIFLWVVRWSAGRVANDNDRIDHDL